MRVARCHCQKVLHNSYLLAKAQIPRLYEKKDLSNFRTDGTHQLLEPLLFKARGFVERYPIEKKGLLITGPSGTGKTHLAIGIIKELVLNKGVECYFCDYSELLSQIRNSYDGSSQDNEMELLRPVFKSDVVVLDDLGASRSTDWVGETVSLILSSRYKENRTTLITSNFIDGPSAKAQESRSRAGGEQAAKARQSIREDTLGDRIGDRMLSRIHEMCRTLLVPGSARDYRDEKNRNPPL
jgi:DNA replication protein DnaC